MPEPNPPKATPSADGEADRAAPLAHARSTHRQRHAWHRRFGSRLRHSLRLKLIVLFLLFALAMSAAFIGGMQRAVAWGWREAARPVLADYVDRLAAEVGSPPSVAKAQALTERLPLSVRIVGPAVNWSSQPERSGSGDRHWGRRHDHSGPEEHESEQGFSSLLSRQTADGHRISFGLGDWSTQRGSHRTGWLTLGVLLLLTALAYFVIRRMLRPLNDIRAGAERFGQGDFATPIPVRRDDELGDLARRINTSAAQLHGMLEAKRALLLSISHELRSPLTRARLNAELLPESQDHERQRTALLRDIAEMRDLIEALLEGERLASPHAALQKAPTDIAALARDVVRELTDAHPFPAPPPANEAAVNKPPVRLIVQNELSQVLLDAARIHVLVRNLVDNALRHGAAVVPAEITLRGDDDALWLTVRDFGPGVAEDQLPHLTEPFFRADQARQRATGGVGLGLYLCRLIAEAHDGTLEARNAKPG
ncbi:MAG: HAMP domain-containing sensor histidine kinase, partial [Burkholderiales bacterium]